MSSFTTPLSISPMPDGRRWRLNRSFLYCIGEADSTNVVVVMAGFVTDFASVPRPLWWLIPSWGKYGKAAVIHDYLYQTHAIQIKYKGLYTKLIVTRKEADDIFLEAMGVLNVAKWRKTVMYKAVRLFGWLAWRKLK